MFVQNQTEYPYYYGMTPYKVSPGYSMSFSIQRSIYEQYNAWPFTYSECSVDEKGELMQPLADSSLYDRFAQSNFTYFRYACLELCYQTGMAEMCNCSCYQVRMKVGDYGYCLPPATSACETKFRDETFFNFDWFATNCLAKCPLECSKPRLENFLSTSVFPPSALYADKALSNSAALYSLRANQSEFKTNKEANMLRLEFYYSSLSYTSVDEEPKMTIDSLIGMIGGHLHLFLGMSLLSFFEIAMISVKFGYYTIRIANRFHKEKTSKIITVVPKGHDKI